MKLYRKKPVVVTAVQYKGGKKSAGIVFEFMNDPNAVWLDSDNIAIPTLEGTMEASPGDFIIRGVKGEHYPCKPDIFERLYEAVEP